MLYIKTGATEKAFQELGLFHLSIFVEAITWTNTAKHELPRQTANTSGAMLDCCYQIEGP
jgi:hypothetical protein